MAEEAARKSKIIEEVRVAAGTGGEAGQLVPLLLARPPADDLAAFDAPALAIAAQRAAEALRARRPGDAQVMVEAPPGFTAGEGDLQLITLVNDDRPFLFDSVVAEIAESMPQIHYISHPVLDLVRTSDGALSSLSASSRSGQAGERVSLIQVATDAAGDPEAAEALRRRLVTILAQVAIVNDDFYAMRERTRRAAFAMMRRAESGPAGAPRALIEEGARLLEWLAEDNFIFLGTREFSYRSDGGRVSMSARDGGALGILRDREIRVLRREGSGDAVGPEAQAFLEAPSPLVVAKANARSSVHRRVYMDYIGVKEYDSGGLLTGEVRIVGLFTSNAYTQPVLSIPYLRQKAQTVIDRFGLRPHSHSGRALLNAIETYSRDELFQIDVDQLESFLATILELGERPRVRILPRIDPFDRFVSILVFVPRDRYDQRLREGIGRLLAEAYDGHVSAFYPAFPEGPLARVHFIIGRGGGATPRPEIPALERRIVDLARNWLDAFQTALLETDGPPGLMALGAVLPQGYRESVHPAEAVVDAGRIAGLGPDVPRAFDFYRRAADPRTLIRLKLYSLDEAPTLSTRVPILENMGFSVGSERSFSIRRPDGRLVHIHDMDLSRRLGGELDLADGGAALEAVYEATSEGRIENDSFNALVLEAGLDWRAANVLRAYVRYLRQVGAAYHDAFAAAVLVRYPELARELLDLFTRAFDPAASREGLRTNARDEAEDDPLAVLARERGAADIVSSIRRRLDTVENIDDDRVVRDLLSAVLATLRTNYYSVPHVSCAPGSRPGAVEPALAFKFDPHRVAGIPAPVPYREIFVFDTRVEGVHLRFGPIARGGLRWSDRSQDYRTEVLGLVKAQQVKNAVIVPVGAKGGFYPKRLPEPGDREAWLAAGKSAYVVFVASLLSLTDNVEGDRTVTPAGLRAHDGPDPYFVVAADKGTATFSDTANAIAQSEDFWLDDAFASGGSAGYDHKGMGITARGAWEAIKRHFREMGRDIQNEPFTVVGCGDMSGDVFGNGMLLSRQIHLLAAFDHRDIFIDPDPDPATTFAERERLFRLPRSSWKDYDRALLSAGGGIYSRQDKIVRLSEAGAQAIGWERTSGTPSEIISAILKAPVDLLWFGGIGTYVRSAAESNGDVGDRANDAVRVRGRDLRAKVVGEGANLAVTQRGRIEFGRAGGRINSDAIDNSAGVNTSDVEVNVKIAFKRAMAENRLQRPERDRLLASMTDEVAALVLTNNYDQTLALSMEHAAGAAILPLQARLITVLEEEGRLARAVEDLPSDAALADLKAAGLGLTRPEVAVLLAYAKIDLFDRLAASPLVDDPYLSERLLRSFPQGMREAFAPDILQHRLRREILATELANIVPNRAGSAFALTLREATGAPAEDVVSAFLIAHDGFDMEALFARIDGLDGHLPGEIQNALYREVALFLRVTTSWLIRNMDQDRSLAERVEDLAAARTGLAGILAERASERAREELAARTAAWTGHDVPELLARDVAMLPLMTLVLDVASVSRETGAAQSDALAALFAVTQLFKIGRLEAAFRVLRPADYFETLALERAASQMSRARRKMTCAALQGFADTPDPVAAWASSRGEPLLRVRDQVSRLAGSGETSVARLTLAAGLLLDLVP